MRNAVVMPMVLIVTLLVSILIGTYLTSTSTHISKEFYRDLAEVRGYWGAYGAKELNSSVTYKYRDMLNSQDIYNIKVTKNSNVYSWVLAPINNSGIDNDDIYTREIEINSISEYNKTMLYSN
jgi:hypothetical protein